MVDNCGLHAVHIYRYIKYACEKYGIYVTCGGHTMHHFINGLERSEKEVPN